MLSKVLCTAMFIIGSCLAAQASEQVAEILAGAEKECGLIDGGTFSGAGAITSIDLTGDGTANTIVDTSRFTCSSARSLFCGSGGCTLHAVIGDQSWQFQAEDWRMIDWDGRPILLIARDGGWCGGAGAEICYEAVSWSNGRKLTVMPKTP